MTIILNFLGGVRTVTGSMHLLTVNRNRFLLDCGLFQGRREEFYRVNSHFPFEPSSIRASIISHAHIDHCGNFPTLVKKGFRSNAYCTPPTRALCWYMLPDSGYVQEEDIKYINKIHRRKRLESRDPLYTKKEAERALWYLKKLDYHQRHTIAPSVHLTFYDSGHILGSSIPVIDIGTKHGYVRIAYAVDLGRPDQPYLYDPEVPKDVDYLIIESTYGGRLRPETDTIEKNLMKAINKTIKRGGKIIIPSFALERTQDVIFFLARLLKNGKIKDIPIYIDSPLAVNITDVFRNNWDSFDERTRQIFKQEDNLFDNKNITYIRRVEDSKKLHNIKSPMIIISASGMCENGRILHHLKNNIENPRNMILVVGYMAQNTLGRKIVEKHPSVNILGRPYRLRAEVVVLDEFSSHADHRNLVNFVKECKGKLKQVFIVHGELPQGEKLRQGIQSLGVKATIPRTNDEVFLSAR